MAFTIRFYNWNTGDTITAARLDGNITNILATLNDGTHTANFSDIQIGSVSVLNTSLELENITKLTVDNLIINGNTLSSSSGDINITPLAGEKIVLDGTINIDAGVVTGATSITSTAFVGGLTGNVTGNVTGTAATVTGATQANITTCANLVTVGALDSGSITSGFGAIDNGSSNITTLGTITGGTLSDGTFSGTAGTYTGGVSITSTTFVGALTGQADTVGTITGLAPDTATTQATQASITTCANLVTVGALDSGSITSGFGSIDNGASNITTTGQVSGGTLTDGTFSGTGGTYTGGVSITSTTFVGALTGQASTVATITGLAPDTATTQAAQPNITSLGTIAALSATTGSFSGNIVQANGVHIGDSISAAAGASVTVIGNDSGSGITAAANNCVMVGGFAGADLEDGTKNTLIGSTAGRRVVDGEGNTVVGANAADEQDYSNNVIIGNTAASPITGGSNVIVGGSAAFIKAAGDNNVIIGDGAARFNVTGADSIYLGNKSGYDETGTSKLFIDVFDRGSEAAGRTDSLIYGVFNATPASQTLALNANVGVTYLLSRSQATKDAAYTASTEEYLFCDATGGAFSITLPAVSAGLQYTIKKTDASANAVTVDGNAAEEIDGETTQVLTTQWDTITVVSTATEWMTI